VGLYTRDGVPRVRGDKVFDPDGDQIGRIKGSKVFGPDGRYVGTVTGSRLVDRSTDSAAISGSFMPSRAAAIARVHRRRAALWGEEPDLHPRRS